MKPLIKAWSFSRWECFMRCPAQFKYKFIDKLKEPKAPAMQRGLEVHKEGENFLKGVNKMVPKSYTKFAKLMCELKAMKPIVETQWAFDKNWRETGWFANNCYLRVITDAGVVYDKEKDADIIDFKTGKKWETNEEQMELFATATFMRYPFLETLTARLWYLDSGDEVIREYHADDADKMRRDWDERAKPLLAATEFPARPNDKCRWCHFRKDNGGPCIYEG